MPAFAPAAPDPRALRRAALAARKAGRHEEGERFELAAIDASVTDPVLIEAAAALVEGDLRAAEQLLRPRLRDDPFDVAAIRMMAELAGRLGRYRDAEALLRRALELAPAFRPARANLATVLHRQNRSVEALAELDRLVGDDPDNLSHANLRAAALGRIGEFDEAITLYEAVLAQAPDQPKVWMSYGHVLKTVGRTEEAITAYRRATAIRPEMGEVWWSLANLKTVRFSDEDVNAMTAALDRPGLSDDDRLHLHFALGKAHEDRRDAEPAFRHYAEGNAIRRRQLPYDSADTAEQVARAKAIYTPDFFAARTGWGCPAPDPIFILGMPRAGSTLVEQILASHSQVEGTMELPDIPAIAARIGAGETSVAELTRDQVRALGEEYLDRTRVQRKTDRPFFIDKLPNNWAHVGLIRLILPHARIVDARRHPLASCFSNFKQHFARGQSFTYGLADVGHYYASYVALMAHFDRVLPGHVHRIIYERLVDDTEAEIRALLAAMRLPFEEPCLRFWETERAVRTASSEQVRRPINREGLEPWKPFEPWLDPLKQALGDVLDTYPEVPALLTVA
ncbi:tetratricopeptide repeat protein [Sphingomonas sp. ID1715]|uniref:tetratricopeptide repeat-containing sulfotransferase family protein n=1 Tax=Sphingomonas sp. ID1715 TaxID=1656898 RepID=UPI001488C79D|nr:sulfotransferase [Sphingomonas sp. ID1715]NNM75817.1 tetratricopeptide repeat protein [Sphingomonas sp. ID1715]